MSPIEFAAKTDIQARRAEDYDHRAAAVEEMIAVNRDTGGDWRERDVLRARASMLRASADYYRAVSRRRAEVSKETRSCVAEPIAQPTPPQPHPRGQGPEHD